MSWFDKKEENQNPEIPMLPEFPKLPELPRLSEIQEEGEEEEIEDSPKQIHQLPSFPHNSLGDKFSQNTIKIQEIPSEFKEASMKVKRTEPVFIRLDKFEESLGIFERIKEKIMDIEKMLKETQDIKDKEEKELKSWEEELKSIKNQIEKVNQDIFSKIE